MFTLRAGRTSTQYMALWPLTDGAFCARASLVNQGLRLALSSPRGRQMPVWHSLGPKRDCNTSHCGKVLGKNACLSDEFPIWCLASSWLRRISSTAKRKVSSALCFNCQRSPALFPNACAMAKLRHCAISNTLQRHDSTTTMGKAKPLCDFMVWRGVKRRLPARKTRAKLTAGHCCKMGSRVQRPSQTALCASRFARLAQLANLKRTLRCAIAFWALRLAAFLHTKNSLGLCCLPRLGNWYCCEKCLCS